MPFPQQNGTLFNRQSIEAINPGQEGCYGIYRSGQWIYVGRGDIRDRLLAHLNGDNPSILREVPTHFVTAVSANSVELEKQLIRELTPCCNQKVG